MKNPGGIRDLLMPWAGLGGGILGAGIAHQFGSQGVFDDCATISPLPLLGVAVLCLVLVTGAGVESWRVVRADAETPARRLVAMISVGCVGLFAIAIILPMIAALMLPPCFQ